MALPTYAELAAAVWVNGVPPNKANIRAYHLTSERALNALISNHVLINGKIVASVASNVLTIVVKTLAGADPSATDPVYFISRSVTLTDGAPSIIAITAASSLTIAAGKTLGTADALPCRVWVVGFNDSGTFRLGAVNLWNNSSNNFSPLDQSLLRSASTAGASAGVITADQTISSKGFRILGSLTWNTALATAGLWSAAPDVQGQWSTAMVTPGNVIQRRRTQTGSTASGTTTVPLDNTIPQITEGDSFVTSALTPVASANLLHIRAKLLLSSTAVVHIIAALFQDATAGALAASAVYAAATNVLLEVIIDHLMLAGTMSSTSFSIRAGGSGAATIRLNGVSGEGVFNGVGMSILNVDELMG